MGTPLNEINTRKILYGRIQEKHGVYYAYVHDANDPERKGRVKLKIPQLYGDSEYDYTEWVDVLTPSSGNDCGCMLTPEKGDEGLALVTTLNGDIQHPICIGFINAGNKNNPDTPLESQELCDGTKCIDCPEKKEPLSEVQEHKEFHNHTNQFWCPKIKTLYKSPKGAAIILGDRGESEFLRFIDQTGQVLEFSCPVKKEKTRKRGLNNALNGDQFDTETDITDEGAYIKLMDLANQFLEFNSKFMQEFTHVVNRNKQGDSYNEIYMSVKPNDEWALMRQNIKGRIQAFTMYGKEDEEYVQIINKSCSYLLLDSKSGQQKNTLFSVLDQFITTTRNLFVNSGGWNKFFSALDTYIKAPTIHLNGNVVMSGLFGSGGFFHWNYGYRDEIADTYISSYAGTNYTLSAGNYAILNAPTTEVSGNTVNIASGTSNINGTTININGDHITIQGGVVDINGTVRINGIVQTGH